MLSAADNSISYPATHRVDHVDTYFGTKVEDPYRWLEDDVRTSTDVADWVKAENKLTEAYLAAIPERETIRRRLTELWDFAQYMPYVKEGGRYFFLKNDGLQNQPVLYVADSLDGQTRVLIDPNTWSKDGTIALGEMGFSDDGKYLAYSRSEAGSDWSVWHVLEIATGKQLPDELHWTKFSNASWTKDNKGFFYSRYEEPKKGAEFQALNFNNKVFYHLLGTDQKDDAQVYYRPEHPEWQYVGEVTEDGHYLVISIVVGTDARQRIVVRDLKGGTMGDWASAHDWVELINNFDHEFTFLGNDGTRLFFKTDVDAPRRRVIAIDLTKPNKEDWQEIIPQSDDTLTEASLVGNRFIGLYLHDASTQVKLFGLDGKLIEDVKLPGIGTAAGFSGKRRQHGKRTETETFYSFSSIATPPSIYRLDLTTGESKLIRRAEAKFDPDRYEVERVFYTSKDGTRVPMFIAHRKGIKLDGTNPTLLYAYGGFNIPMPPVFSIGRAAWLEMGGVYAQACLRGGSEYGEAWHKAGTKLHKQNVFDDFIAAAEWLIANKYTQKEKLAIQGGSNGGLLVGAVETQRPDLFGACLPAVGVMDMLRFQKFTEGRTWVDDYGSSDDNAEMFKALRAYSPYHNIHDGTCYPPTLVTTADTDDRVVPGHSFKFTAAMQRAQSCDKPILILITSRAGHGGGKPTSKRIAETADLWAFLVKSLGMNID
jgi:prolyl oligopeptidase